MTNLRSGVAYHPESRQTHRPRPIGQYLHVESIVNKPQSKRFCCIMKNIGVVAAIWCWWTTPSVILAYTLSASRVEGNAPAVGLDRTNPRQHLRTTKSFSVGNQNSRRKTTQYALDLHRMAIEGDRRNPTNDQESAPPGARLMADANEPVNDDDDDKEKKSSGTAEGGDNDDDEPILNMTDQREKFETETNALETVESLEQETSEERAAPEGEESSPEDQNERVSELVLGQPANQDQRDPEPSTEGDDGDDDTANDDGTADDNGNDDVNDDGTANDDVNDDGTANDDGNKNDDVGANSGDRVHMDNEPVDGGKTRESNNLIDPTMDDDVSSQTERQSVDRKIRQVGILSVLIGVLAMIFTAWQMSDNPDGMYAAMCRLVITIMGLVLGLILRPCRICLGGPGSNRHQQGHIPVSTMDYGYRDPSLEMS